MKNSDIEDLNKLIKKNNEKLRSKTSYLLSKIQDLEKKVLILEKKSIKIPLLTTNIMNNKFVKIAIVAAVIIGGLLAYKKINAAELHGSFSASYNSELQFRGVSQGGENIQSAFDTAVTLGGFEIGLDGLVNTRDGTDEVQLGASTALELVDGISTSVGVVNYTSNHLLGNATELYAEFGAEIILDASARVYYNLDSEVTTFEGALSHKLDLWEDYCLCVSASVGNTEIGGERATYYGVDGTIKRPVDENTSLFLGVGLTDLQDIVNEDEVVSVIGGLTHSF